MIDTAQASERVGERENSPGLRHTTVALVKRLRQHPGARLVCETNGGHVCTPFLIEDGCVIPEQDAAAAAEAIRSRLVREVHRDEDDEGCRVEYVYAHDANYSRVGGVPQPETEGTPDEAKPPPDRSVALAPLRFDAAGRGLAAKEEAGAADGFARLTFKAAGELLGVSRATLSNRIKSGHLTKEGVTRAARIVRDEKFERALANGFPNKRWQKKPKAQKSPDAKLPPSPTGDGLPPSAEAPALSVPEPKAQPALDPGVTLTFTVPASRVEAVGKAVREALR